MWVFTRGYGKVNVGLGIIGGKCTSGLPRRALLEFIDQEFPGARTDAVHCDGVPVGAYIHPLVQDGADLVGDAARALQGDTINYKHLVSCEKNWKNPLFNYLSRHIFTATLLMLKAFKLFR